MPKRSAPCSQADSDPRHKNRIVRIRLFRSRYDQVAEFVEEMVRKVFPPEAAGSPISLLELRSLACSAQHADEQLHDARCAGCMENSYVCRLGCRAESNVYIS